MSRDMRILYWKQQLVLELLNLEAIERSPKGIEKIAFRYSIFHFDQ